MVRETIGNKNADSSNSKDLKAIFAPLITDILRLIDDQVKSVKIKRQNQGVTVRNCCVKFELLRSNSHFLWQGIFLVGGFGSSQYLKAKVEKQYPGIQVLQPTDAWAAIVKCARLCFQYYPLPPTLGADLINQLLTQPTLERQ